MVEVADPPLDAVDDGALGHVLALVNWGVESHLLVLELDLDVENRLKIVLLDVGMVDLVVQVAQGSSDGGGDTVEDDLVDVVHVGLPERALLVDLDGIMHLLDQLVDLLAIFFDDLLLGGEEGLVDLRVVIRGHGLILTLDDLHIDVLETLAHFVNRLLHLGDDFKGGVDDIFSLLDEFVDVVTLPFQLFQSGVEGDVHHFDTVFDEGLFNRVETGNDFVVVADDEVEAHNLNTIDLILFEDFEGAGGDIKV